MRSTLDPKGVETQMAKKKSTRKISKKTASRSGAVRKTRAKSQAKSGAKKKAANSKPTGQPAITREFAADEKERAVLGGLRVRIDRCDRRLVKLLNERAQLVVEVGDLKRGSGIPIYAPHREKQVLDKALGLNDGPLHDATIEAVYRELMSGSFALEQPLRIGYLGPEGSFSHQASTKHFGSSVEFDNLHTIEGVFTEVRRGHVDYGLVPIENSIGGGISETLDAFREHARHVTVYAEALIGIHHALLANSEPGAIRRIHSKPEIFQQCRRWLATQYPDAELIPESSSSRAAQIAAEESALAESIATNSASAAIGTPLAGEIYGLKLLFENIEDHPGNVTRFLVLSKQRAEKSKEDKTSIMFTTGDRPGALVSVLALFEEAGINLSHIDKRPSQVENWQYTFFLDALGHRDDAEMAAVLRRCKAFCEDMVVLGSYPRAKRIL